MLSMSNGGKKKNPLKLQKVHFSLGHYTRRDDALDTGTPLTRFKA